MKKYKKIIEMNWPGYKIIAYKTKLVIEFANGTLITFQGPTLTMLRHMTQMSQLGYSFSDNTKTELEMLSDDY